MSYDYSNDFKIKVVKDTLDRQDGVSLNDKAKEFGISPTTISKWIKLYRAGQLTAAQITDDSSSSNADTSEKTHVRPSTRRRRAMRRRHHNQSESGEKKENPSTVNESVCQSQLKQYQADIKKLKNEILVKNRVISGMAEVIVIQQSQTTCHIY